MRRAILAIVGTAVALVMILSFKTHGVRSAVLPPAATPPAAISTKPGAPATVTGDAVDTRWGPVQVKVTVTNGRVTAATAIVYPLNNARDEQINSYAIPTLNSEAVQAGNANIDMVSGATYTSEGYIQSLQSALSKA